jgi:hypothetical protein
MPQRRAKRTKPRDFAAEYARRIARALSKGLSRSQGRGHPKATEAPASAKRPPKPISDEKLQRALRVLRQEKNLAAAAKSAGVSPERLKHAAANRGAITKKGRRWIVRPDLPRRMPLYSRGQQISITVGDPEAASSIGRYMSAVARFLTTNDRALLKPFVGQSVTDITSKAHPFETNPNALYRLASAGTESFEQVYRVVI